jgi:4-diphosphocytidyl-2-C-methyl-D-erythritol kinase
VKAHAKLNLALVVGPHRPDGKHEVATVLQAIDLHDDVELEPADELAVEGFPDDTIVRAALESLAAAAGVAPRWRARIEKRIPVAAGLGGGSSDAATALRVANALLPEPLAPARLHQLAGGLGADVPFFLAAGSQLATGDGTELVPLELPRDYVVLLVAPGRERKESTAAVYGAFDELGGADGYAERRARLVDELSRIEQPRDLARLPRNDLASSPLSTELEHLGAFRSDVTGAGPTVYGLFEREERAREAAASLASEGRTLLARPIA